jgi:hypothetical protein
MQLGGAAEHRPVDSTSHHEMERAIGQKRLGLVMIVIVGLAALIASAGSSAGQVVLVPPSEQLRFQLVGNEPIASPDGRGVVQGWSVLVFKDREAGRCYTAFQRGDAIAVESATHCPHE